MINISYYVVDLDTVIQFARTERWSKVDAAISSLIRDPSVVARAVDDLLRSGNAHIRDLGASILQKARAIPSRALPKLYAVMHSHPKGYDGFRAACALAVHSPSYSTRDIRDTLRYFTRDKDVGHMACGYLRLVS